MAAGGPRPPGSEGAGPEPTGGGGLEARLGTRVPGGTRETSALGRPGRGAGPRVTWAAAGRRASPGGDVAARASADCAAAELRDSPGALAAAAAAAAAMAQYKGAASEAGRAMHLMKKREKQREQMEQMKQRIAEENIMKSNIDKKFSAHYDAVEAELKSSTVGLVTLNDMKAKQEALVKEREKQLAKKEQSKELQLKLEKLREKERKKEAKRKISSLSFTLEEEEEAGEEEEEAGEDEELEREEVTTKKRKLGKNPDVDTSFLPDRDREEEENRLREELRQEWEAKQEKIKSEEIEITFSYWDGSGHRRTVKMKKGNTVQQFLQKALEILRKDFSELRSAGVEQLMYIKEDLIIPHHHSFYDFIVTKARGKSGPLFNFDVHDDVRLLSDATVEKDESHAGKVVLRSWYEKNKHIFPASRWEPYDPEKKWDKYTVRRRLRAVAPAGGLLGGPPLSSAVSCPSPSPQIR
ncbi:Protein FAM50A [Galemys pyrenaicus]|uniref:Protein FAM50A n=1 Tax=Galemys pyrenaicus TaxID=202257 RepID=A0A8J6A1M6_GALPY|nr:Protein FAM50A [Galemys pyrenaicus]